MKTSAKYFGVAVGP